MSKRPVVILMAEDDEGNFRLTKRKLTSWGVTSPVIRFSNGQNLLDFLDFFASTICFQKSDILLITDINLPRISGIEILKNIAANPLFSNVIRVVLSAHDEPDIIESCKINGCHDYFVKPLKKESFFKFIETANMPLQFESPLLCKV